MDDARERFAAARVARLATADANGVPHAVPLVFVLSGTTIYSAVDAKPKRTTALRRLANVRANPRVSVLVDHYDDDWSALWWVRADGVGRVLDTAPGAVDLLAAKYGQYRENPPAGPFLSIEVDRWTAWSFSSRA
ncbi:TIGR03668 family PPOX class F420-dependent oxidoreductase [Virgisporangium ochraceum]|uniref:PPOX class F420-dependent oxidoreductase n=1 Tax=Virgisporangium ochraceum TaxID=65505 RepID=A0A8J3ZN97_9ACTN|nr:TIGR03668 family PPOX class F420-dependent oxidoreductase [Virgisporangium ochraceum]GIJ67429.1 PPOX class F420-dependent oxidoreductase [Virgisporangium ochraceum]